MHGVEYIAKNRGVWYQQMERKGLQKFRLRFITAVKCENVYEWIEFKMMYYENLQQIWQEKYFCTAIQVMGNVPVWPY